MRSVKKINCWFHFIILLPSCFLHHHTSVVSGSNQSSVITVTVKANNLTEDGTISTHNDELYCALLNTSEDSTSKVEFLGSDMFTMDTVGQSYAFTPGPLDAGWSGDLSLVLFEMDTDSSREAMSRLVAHHYYELAHALHVNDQQTIHRLLGDDDLLGIHVLSSDKISKGNTETFGIRGIQFFNRYSFTIMLSPSLIILPQD